MKYLFLGGVYPPSELKEIAKASSKGLDIASDNLQWSLITLLRRKVELEVISVLPVRSFPRGFRKIFIFGKAFQSNYEEKNVTVSFINVPIFKHFSILLSLIFYWKKYFFCSKKMVIISYGLSTPKLLSLIILKMFKRSISLIVYIPDLPQFMSSESSFLYRFLKGIDQYILKWCLNFFDKFILINSRMSLELNLKRNCIEIEGVYSGCFEKLTNHFQKENKTILYAGAVEKRYGLLHLITAFSKIVDPEFVLWICGTGSDEKELRSMASGDRRITFFGFVPHNEVLMMQLKATILVNPRLPHLTFTKYSFPSKTIEYFASGTPVVMYISEGFPAEYQKFCFVPKDFSITTLTELLERSCNLPMNQLLEIGVKAKNFIMTNKSIEAQTERIWNFICPEFEN